MACRVNGGNLRRFGRRSYGWEIRRSKSWLDSGRSSGNKSRC